MHVVLKFVIPGLKKSYKFHMAKWESCLYSLVLERSFMKQWNVIKKNIDAK